MSQEEIVQEVKRIMPTIDMISKSRKLGFDYGYLYNAAPPYWECELYDKTGKTVEYYKAPTTKELIKKMVNKIK
jgi:hypothetical protein